MLVTATSNLFNERSESRNLYLKSHKANCKENKVTNKVPLRKIRPRRRSTDFAVMSSASPPSLPESVDEDKHEDANPQETKEDESKEEDAGKMPPRPRRDRTPKTAHKDPKETKDSGKDTKKSLGESSQGKLAQTAASVPVVRLR